MKTNSKFPSISSLGSLLANRMTYSCYRKLRTRSSVMQCLLHLLALLVLILYLTRAQ